MLEAPAKAAHRSGTFAGQGIPHNRRSTRASTPQSLARAKKILKTRLTDVPAFLSVLVHFCWGRPRPLILIKGPNLHERMRTDNREDPPVGYKTILVHCNGRQRLSRLLDPAVRLSAAFGARLIGLSVSPPITVIPAGMPGTPDTIVIDELTNAYRADNPAMKAAFHEAAAAQNITTEWREEDAGTGTVTRILARQGGLELSEARRRVRG
jgi:hypothetical protein